MRALLFGTVDEGPGYPRIRALTASLEGIGVSLDRLTAAHGISDRTGIFRNPRKALRALLGLLRARRTLAARGRLLPPPDLVLVGYPAFFAADLARRIWPGVPVVVDLFLSLVDTVAGDRGLLREGGLPARLLRLLDRRTCAAGDLVLLDTEETARFVSEATGLPRERFYAFPCGDPDAPAEPAPYIPPGSDGPLRLFFAGTGVPLQGVEIILEAVRRASAPLELTLVGGGEAARRARGSDRPGRVRFVSRWLSREELGRELRKCHLSLGIFGASAKADRVVPLKVYHGLAEGRPVLTGDSRAVRTLLAPGREVLVCPRGDARALAKALEEIRTGPDRLASLAVEGRRAFQERFSLEALGRHWLRVLDTLGLPAPAGPSSRIRGKEARKPARDFLEAVP